MSLLVSLALLIGTIVVYATLLKPAYGEINQLRGELSATENTIDGERENVEKLKSLLEQYKSVQVAQQNIAQVLPGDEAYPQLFNQFDALTRSNGISLQSVNITLVPLQGVLQSNSAPRVGVVEASLALVGPYANFKNFLQSLETNIRLMDVKSVQINPGIGSGQNYLYNIVVDAYYQTL